MPHILVIDDAASIRAVLRATFEAAGYRVTEAAGGKAGLAAYRADPADVVFCDLLMPETDGLAVILALTREFPGVRIIAMSAGSLDDRLNTLLPVADGLGALAVLPKPFRPATAVGMAAMALAQPARPA